MDENQERDLDRALEAGRDPSDHQLATLVAQAELLRSELQTETPAARHERALFVQGIASRSRSPRPVRFLVPAALGVAALVTVGSLGRVALPGQTLYPVREALASVGLAKSSTEEVERRISDARGALTEASTMVDSNPASARALAFTAIGELQRARRFLTDVQSGEKGDYLSSINRLEDRAAVIVATIGGETDIEPSVSPDPTNSPDEDDNSGPGSDDDNSGPGSGEDNSGSGSGDDGDNSGSGSDDDNSGSGSGDDNSGSGGGDGDSSGSGSGGGDSSGSGSGGGDNSGSGS